MSPLDLLTLFRSEMGDVVEPYLWDDSDALSYIDDAQTMFARRTDGIADARTTSVTEVAITPDLGFFDLHPAILTIRSATRSDTGRPVEVVNHEDLPARGWYFDGRVGPVQALVIGEEENVARVWPTPNETVTLKLSVFRLPLLPITADSSAFEIAAEHHPHLLLWAKARAYLKQDTETFDKTKALEFEQRFLSYCETVKLEQARKRHKPRTVAYGGI